MKCCDKSAITRQALPGSRTIDRRCRFVRPCRAKWTPDSTGDRRFQKRVHSTRIEGLKVCGHDCAFASDPAPQRALGTYLGLRSTPHGVVRKICRKASSRQPAAPASERAPSIMQANHRFDRYEIVDYGLLIVNPEQTAYSNSKFLFGGRGTPFQCVSQPDMELRKC
jgi:hypothetical protein